MGDPVRLKPGPMVRAGALLVLAGLATETASRFLATRLEGLPRAHDTVLDALPYLIEARYVGAAAMSAGVLLFVWYAVRVAPERAPELAAMIALMYLFRAAMIVLTPFPSPRPEEVWMPPIFTNGMFPSGHTAAALMFAWLTDAGSAPRARRVQQALAAVVIVTLLLSRGHYSIDIVGGGLLAYFVAHQWANGRIFGPVKRFVLGR